MKILQIFGAVVAIHLLAFVLIFATPGCQTGGSRHAATPDATVPGGTTTAATQPATAYNLGTTVPTQPASGADTAAQPVVTYTPPAGAGRAAPTRPGSPAAIAIAPPATPVADVAPVSSYTVARGDSLWSIAKKNNLTVTELAKANNLGVNAVLQPGRKLLIPGKAAGPVDLAAPAGATYKVRSGDTLASIARKHNVTPAALREANGLSADIVRIGQELRLPAGAKAGATEPTAAEAAVSAARASGEEVTHIIQPGEKLGTIARKYQVTVNELAAANNITDPARIRAGQKLVIPGFKAVGAKPAATTPAPATVTATEPAATTGAAPIKFDLKPPPPGQDLEAGLKDAPTATVPTVKVEEQPPKN